VAFQIEFASLGHLELRRRQNISNQCDPRCTERFAVGRLLPCLSRSIKLNKQLRSLSKSLPNSHFAVNPDLKNCFIDSTPDLKHPLLPVAGPLSKLVTRT
jgi:hypothetical protein